MFSKSFIELLKDFDAYTANTKTRVKQEMKFAQVASKVFQDSLTRQYIQDDTKPSVMRLSQIGRQPALDILARHFKVIPMGNFSTVTPQQRYLFHVGDTFEAWVTFMLMRLGYTIISTQDVVDYYGVQGHTDFLCSDPTDGEVFVLECKTACSYYFEKCKKFSVGDERGYLTQLGAYVESYRNQYPDIKGYWLVANKDTQELHIECVKPEVYEPRLLRLRKIVDAVNTLECFDDAYSLFRPQPPSVELRNKVPATWEDGSYKLYVPAEIKHPEIHYVTHVENNIYGKPRQYVDDYYYPEQYQNLKPNAVSTAFDYANLKL